MLLRFNNLTEAPGNIGGGGPKGTEDIIDFLKGDDDKPDVINLDPPKDKNDKTGKEDDETDKTDEEADNADELTELEEDLDEPDEEDLELTTPVPRREILAKYPKLFKEFPYLEKAYYREQQYTQLLPTLDDAKEAVSKATTLDHVEQDLFAGNTEKILAAVKGDNPEAFNKLVDNYLPTLAKVDEKAYHHVVGNVIKHVIIGMVKESNKSENEALKSAASLLNQFIFGSSDFVPPSSLTKEGDTTKKADPVADDRAQWINERFEASKDELNTKVNNTIRATIDANMDPKESMTSYVKNAAVRDAVEKVVASLETDKRLKVVVDKLWENAVKNKFSKDSTDKIRSAYLARAKGLLPTVIKSARNEALKGIGKRVTDDSTEREDKKEESRNTKPRRSAPPDDSRHDKKKPNLSNSLAFLMSDD